MDPHTTQLTSTIKQAQISLENLLPFCQDSNSRPLATVPKINEPTTLGGYIYVL